MDSLKYCKNKGNPGDHIALLGQQGSGGLGVKQDGFFLASAPLNNQNCKINALI